MITDRDVAVLVPMLGRPHTVAPLCASLAATAPRARVLFLVSPDDTAVHAAIDAAGRERLTVPYSPIGDYARKINHGYRATEEPWLFTGACDLLFHPGWVEAAAATISHTTGVLGTNDLGSPRVQAGQHSTHSLVSRRYADTRGGALHEPGTIYYEGYIHEYVDDELVQLAMRRGMYDHAHDCHVEHLHPDWGKAPSDDLYRQQRTRMALGARLFRSRRRLWS